MNRVSRPIPSPIQPFLLLSILVLTFLTSCAGHPGSVGRDLSPESGTLTVRVLSYNIHHGEGVDGVFDLERLARVITAADPDLVALQEVDRETTRSSGVDQATELGRLTGMHAVFGRAMDFAGGGYGNAVLSRWPFLRVEDHILPASEGHEPRAALAATVVTGESGREILFISTHLDQMRDPADRMAQAMRIDEIFLPETRLPMILAGDLNATHESETMALLLGEWNDTSAGDPVPTSPSADPDRKIDHVLYRPAEVWRVVEVRVLDEEIASDHRPLMAVLELTGQR